MVSAVWAVSLNLQTAQVPVEPFVDLSPAEPELDFEDLELPVFQYGTGGIELSRQANLLTEILNRSRVEVLRYTVQEGDSVFGIAERFELKPETILWGNFETLNDDPHLLRPGQELNVLPIDGTFYEWESGDNLDQVADFFGVDNREILEWPGNKIDLIHPIIEPGTWLVVPGGQRAFRQWLVPTIARGQAGVGSAFGPGGCSGNYSGAIGAGGFIWPAPNQYVSGNAYWSGHLAIDIAAGVGTRVWAADSGVIVFSGWSTVGYGYMVMVDHGNGWQTLYAHLSQVSAGCGQSVGQGQTLGFAGSTGNSTGPHLHFETRFEGGFINPWYVLP